MHRADRSRLPEAAIEIVRRPERVGIDPDDGVQRGAVLVVRVNPLEVLLDEPAARQRAVAERGLNLLDGGFLESERRRRLRRERGEDESDGDHDERRSHAA